MIEPSDQTLKVGQGDLDVGQVLRFPSLDERKSIAIVEPKKGTSRNKGHKATGRNREHLTQSEIDILLNRAKSTSQNGTRNHCIVLLGYRHGLRVSEIAHLKWSDVDWNRGTLYINRSKGSISGTHPMQGDEIRALRKLQRDYPDTPFLFVDRTHAPLDSKAISKMIKRLGDGDKALGFPIHAHMLRHTCGFLMCDRGYDLRLVQAWLGHSNIQNTVVYTALSSKQFDKVSW